MTMRARALQLAIVVAEAVAFSAMMATIFFGMIALGALVGAPQ